MESVVVDDPMEAAGVNDRHQLAVAEAELRDRINERWMRRGVTMVDPEHTYIDTTVELSADVVLYPGTHLQGRTVVAGGAELGPSTQLSDCTVGPRAVVTATIGRNATVGAGRPRRPLGLSSSRDQSPCRVRSPVRASLEVLMTLTCRDTR